MIIYKSRRERGGSPKDEIDDAALNGKETYQKETIKKLLTKSKIGDNINKLSGWAVSVRQDVNDP